MLLPGLSGPPVGGLAGRWPCPVLGASLLARGLVFCCAFGAARWAPVFRCACGRLRLCPVGVLRCADAHLLRSYSISALLQGFGRFSHLRGWLRHGKRVPLLQTRWLQARKALRGGPADRPGLFRRTARVTLLRLLDRVAYQRHE